MFPGVRFAFTETRADALSAHGTSRRRSHRPIHVGAQPHVAKDVMHTAIHQARALRSTALRADLPDSPTAQAVIAYLAESALSCLDVYGIFDLAAELITEVLDVEFVKILHQPDPGEALVLEAGRGWDSSVTLGETTVPSDSGSQAGYTLMVGGPVLVEDLATEHRFEGPELLLDHRIVSGITVVIPGEFHPYGVLGVHARASPAASPPRKATSSDPLPTSSAVRRRTSELGSRSNGTRLRVSDGFSITRRLRSVRSLCSRAAVSTGSTTRLRHCSQLRERILCSWNATSSIRRRASALERSPRALRRAAAAMA